MKDVERDLKRAEQANGHKRDTAKNVAFGAQFVNNVDAGIAMAMVLVPAGAATAIQVTTEVGILGWCSRAAAGVFVKVSGAVVITGAVVGSVAAAAGTGLLTVIEIESIKAQADRQYQIDQANSLALARLAAQNCIQDHGIDSIDTLVDCMAEH
jgi:hypothetical protein